MGTDIGYKAAGDDTDIEGAKKRECKNCTSDDWIEEMIALVNLDIPVSVKIDDGGGSRFSGRGSEDWARSTRFSESGDNLVLSAD